MRTRQLALALLPTLLLPACVSTTTTTRTWGDPYAQREEWVRYGRVEQVRETVQRQQGDPAAGAVAGAIIGGLLGAAVGGHTHYDRWGYAHRSGDAGSAVVGAVGGAVVGAAASSGAAEDRFYEVFVRFEDGGTETYTYRGALPFQPGDAVTLTPRGLVRG
ncbi:hypothetical protein [Anaeromyxobacter oryzae]|uniref:Glycine zipper 2TM domain-containing protein n=1 Tax=Anaeromyxobacter oryzae TaxID=2918170 RepID=A0ABM7WNY4_9BACT|nr:hypothetical protein [Anaeromyxobacter oryzae]BDG01168.1 hypothetical protein AMOR_01640 [Anaeromyxobacter oryzae]